MTHPVLSFDMWSEKNECMRNFSKGEKADFQDSESMSICWKFLESQKYHENLRSTMKIPEILGVQNPPFPP
jgi:hypothetical protein